MKTNDKLKTAILKAVMVLAMSFLSVLAIIELSKTFPKTLFFLLIMGISGIVIMSIQSVKDYQGYLKDNKKIESF